jgi:hypothetical protein
VMERSKKNKSGIHNLIGLIWVLWISVWLFGSIGIQLKRNMVIGTENYTY